MRPCYIILVPVPVNIPVGHDTTRNVTRSTTPTGAGSPTSRDVAVPAARPASVERADVGGRAAPATHCLGEGEGPQQLLVRSVVPSRVLGRRHRVADAVHVRHLLLCALRHDVSSRGLLLLFLRLFLCLLLSLVSLLLLLLLLLLWTLLLLLLLLLLRLSLDVGWRAPKGLAHAISKRHVFENELCAGADISSKRVRFGCCLRCRRRRRAE